LSQRPVSCHSSAGCTSGISQLNRASAIHFFTHDRLDLANHAQADRHVGIDAGARALDHSGAHHQLVADDFGVGRGFFRVEMKKRDARMTVNSF
jgi:hypothetical protein